MSGRYILDEQGQPIEDEDLIHWAAWFETANRHVAKDVLPDGTKISTIFLGLDHGFGEQGLPVLWETMIFGGPHDQYQERYTSREEAIAGHAKAVDIANFGAEKEKRSQ